jgi:hypothetical protein
MANQVCKINLKCVLHQEVRVSLSVFRTLHVELNYIVSMIFGEIFLLRFSVQKNTLKSLSQSLTFLPNMMRTYGAQTIAISFLSRSYLQTKKSDRESWRALKQFVVATSSFMASGPLSCQKTYLFCTK